MERSIRNTIYVLIAAVWIEIVLCAAAGSAVYASTWPSYRGNDENNGLASFDTPTEQQMTEAAWIRDFSPSSGSTSTAYAPNMPIVIRGETVNDLDLITASYKTVYRINAANGDTLATGTLDYPVSNMMPMTYARVTDGDKVIFCPLTNGNIEALDADTLVKLWTFRPGEKDDDGNYIWGISPEMTQDDYRAAHSGQEPPAELITDDGNVLAPNERHQSLTPITYSEGLIYTGFTTYSPTYYDYYVAIATCDMTIPDPVTGEDKDYHAGDLVWKYKSKGGFYRNGAVAIGNAVIFGTQDGKDNESGTPDGSSRIVSLDKKTGTVISEHILEGVGDICSSIVYDKAGIGRLFWTASGGFLCSAAVDAATGEISDVRQRALGGTDPYVVSTPVVCDNTVYLSYSTGDTSGYFAGHDAAALYNVFKVETGHYSECSPLITDVYKARTGYLYAYLANNDKKGGVTVVQFRIGANDDVTANVSQLFAANGYGAYGASSLIADGEGRLYYKSDSNAVFAIRKCSKVELTGVKNLKVTPYGSKVTLKYSKDKQATSYKILYRINETGSFKSATTTKTTYSIKVKNPSVVTVKIRAEHKDAAKSLVGAYTTPITVYSAKSKIKKLVRGKQSFTVTFSKHKICNGYQIQYSMKKKTLKYGPMLYKKGATKVKYKVSGLMKNKTYYVRVRSCRIVGGTRIKGRWVGGTTQYGNWSTIKKVKTK